MRDTLLRWPHYDMRLHTTTHPRWNQQIGRCRRCRVIQEDEEDREIVGAYAAAAVQTFHDTTRNNRRAGGHAATALINTHLLPRARACAACKARQARRGRKCARAQASSGKAPTRRATLPYYLLSARKKSYYIIGRHTIQKVQQKRNRQHDIHNTEQQR